MTRKYVLRWNRPWAIPLYLTEFDPRSGWSPAPYMMSSYMNRLTLDKKEAKKIARILAEKDWDFRVERAR